MSTVLVTGTSSGVGQACVTRFAARGWNVVALTRNPHFITSNEHSDRTLVVRSDLTDDTSVERAVLAGVETFGSIDVVVNNAGYGLVGLLEDTPLPEVKDLFDVNLFAAVRVTKAILPHFREQRRGCIVNVSSAAALMGLPMAATYSSSKFALEGLSEALSYELSSQNISVRIVECGGIRDTYFASNARLCSGTARVSYAGFISRAFQMFARMTKSAQSTAEDIASLIYAAATDKTHRLRFVSDDIYELARLRRSSSEDEFMSAMRSRLPSR
jgi:NAD(P)-dependent dehydrogenase (short-subunit alcohol dehydrogenase family)